MKIIFLDIDGVLNCENAYKAGFCRREDDYGQSFYPPSSALLNKLILETGAKIVISSTWRGSGLSVMQNMWRDRGMCGEVIGITGYNKTRIRGIEIDEYLSDVGFCHINWDPDLQREYMSKSGIDNYIIIDDDSDMLYNQRNHFVHVLPSPRNKDGFNKKYYREALSKLRMDVIDLNYEK